VRQGRPPPAETCCRGGGFALIIVLWTLVLIAFVAAHLVGSGRVEIRIAGNLLANAMTEAAADGAVYQTIFELLDPDPERRRPLDGSEHTLAIGDCRATVRLSDETARINPNLAAPALLEALLRVTGSDPETARRLADAIAAWVGATGAARPQNAMAAEYRAAGLDYRPPGEPLETLAELQRVLGMTQGVFAAIRPHLSPFAPAEPSLAHADPVVTAAMMAFAPGSAPGRVAAAQSEVLIARIAVTAQGSHNGRATRSAIVRVTPSSRGYAILSWEAGD
jgi:general secretion pathway protein K